MRDWSENEPFIRRTDKRIIAMVTSYETVCATAGNSGILRRIGEESQCTERNQEVVGGRLGSGPCRVQYGEPCLQNGDSHAV